VVRSRVKRQNFFYRIWKHFFYSDTRSGIHFIHALTILSSLPGHLVEHVSGLGHLGGVEHQVDVVVLEEIARLERGHQ
jgi:hypothetical protein